MTFKQAKNDFLRQLKLDNQCLTNKELINKIGLTTIRCYWVDYVDYLVRDHQITERQCYSWGQVL